MPLISCQNKKELNRTNNKNDQDISMCNCLSKDFCPLNGQYLQGNLVYKVKITTQNKIKEYI